MKRRTFSEAELRKLARLSNKSVDCKCNYCTQSDLARYALACRKALKPFAAFGSQVNTNHPEIIMLGGGDGPIVRVSDIIRANRLIGNKVKR
jgi:hypothetical protein